LVVAAAGIFFVVEKSFKIALEFTALFFLGVKGNYHLRPSF